MLTAVDRVSRGTHEAQLLFQIQRHFQINRKSSMTKGVQVERYGRGVRRDALHKESIKSCGEWSANASLAKPFFGQTLPAELFYDRRLNISNL
jgi:hypothetical protein